ncbi:tetratricopeptide repeat protein [Novilysobacter selenitireducens]|uniref:Tetratricopeptide repeat protein n=1 Tax=Novilysobacter selenitireducens TaxID=2872639 RepID=A0ABS7T438_9GAMM|nr:tetratricopeptide repeat protein [Lysobacter selenitireducens]MBZ4038632.1 tetratricopeptide repeat protein [Lysobacter selenitireducens]
MPPGDPRPALRQRLQANPGDAIAWIVLSEHELDAGDAAAGEAACRRALALQPGHPEALARLGRAQWMQGRRSDAADSLRMAAANAPDHPGIAVWLGHVLEDVGEAEAALAAYAHAHALLPGDPQVAAYLLAWRRKLCDWRDLDRLAAQVRESVRRGQGAVEPFAFLSEDGTPAEQLQCARLRAAALARQVRPLPPAPARTPGPLRVGFLSNGFGAHPTGLLTVAMFEALQPLDGIDVHLFALNADDGGAIRRRLRAAAQLVDVSGHPHAQVAAAVRAADIDVLVDLRGWGGGGAPEVLAMRPARVQVNWLAYPGTSGAPWIDWVLADGFVLPPAPEPHFSERVLRLPRCFQPSDTRRALPQPATREACGLPADGVVLCCFNNSYKLNPASVDRALAVLRQVPGSVLWLLSGPGRADDRLRAHARARGIDPARLVFMAKQPHAEYLARLQQADLFLDTGPYNAHTTASDALWAGCPVLTRPGDTFAARVAGSLNHHLGMASMNVVDDAAFVARAVELARDPAALAAVRGELVARREASGLFDMDGFAADFAQAMHAIAAPL